MKKRDTITWTTFVDRVKYFDSINHDILFKLFNKFGIVLILIVLANNFYKKPKLKLVQEIVSTQSTIQLVSDRVIILIPYFHYRNTVLV